MAKNTAKHKNIKAVSQPIKKTTITEERKDLLSIMDGFFDKQLSWLIWIILGLTFLFSLLLFDSRVSLSGDDSYYIIKASEFIHSFTYPEYYGPLYPMVLSIFVAIFGINLIPLKILSLLSVMGFMYLFFIAFRSRIPSTLLVISLLALSVNSFLLYYASQTYSEAFYLFVQMVLLLVFFRNFIDTEHTVTLKQDIKRHILLAICLLALVLTRNAGYSAFIAITGYFFLKGQWKNLIFSIAAFGILLLVFKGLKYTLWNVNGTQLASQGSHFLQKDYYNPQKGNEDIAGFYTRLIDNSNLYLSRHFISIIGLRKVTPSMAPNGLITILIYLLTIGSMVITFRKNKYLFFTGLLTGASLLVTFIVLQTNWDQSRLIITAVPLLLLILLSLIYYVSKIDKFKILQLVIPLMALLIFFQSLVITAGTIKANQKISGRYGGLTTDWKNYLKASEWAAKNLPEDAIVACRKASISFVYGNGRKFYGIMALPAYSTDVFINNWIKNDSAYMMFNYADFNGKQLNPELFAMLKENMLAMLFVGDTVYFAEKINDSIKNKFYSEIKSAGFNYISSANTIRSFKEEGKVMKLYYPDSLLYQLQNAGVTHILTANLRRNSNRKDGYIINTVERYMAFIQEKYPLIFTKVSQIGDDNNEPATIVKIDYEKYGRKVRETKAK